jgi:hypothetical protein
MIHYKRNSFEISVSWIEVYIILLVRPEQNVHNWEINSPNIKLEMKMLRLYEIQYNSTKFSP